MQRVMVIGCPGSGKSTFSRALHEATGLPLVYLDRLYWNADRTAVSRELFLERLQVVLAQRAFILDGNYAATMEQRLRVCDTAFFLDYPAAICLRGVAERRGKPRPDMPWIEMPGEEDAAFLRFITDYATVSRPAVLELLNRYADREIIIFRSREEADAYLRRIRS